MQRFSKRKLQEVRDAPHRVAAIKFNAVESKRYAIQKGMNAVKKCWPDAKISLGDIMELDMNTRNNQKNRAVEHPNALSNKCGQLNRGQVLFVFKKAANDFCKKHDREPLF
jgi:hypothetical protein